MPDLSVEPLIQTPPAAKPPSQPRQKTISRALLAGALSLAAIGALAWRQHLSTAILPSALNLAAAGTPLKGQQAGRTNILLLGLTQDGQRTDSLILASYYHQEKKLVTLNIPRDLYVNDGHETDKLVSVYAHAKQRQPNDPNAPADEVRQFIAKEYRLPIDYWVTINMDGFKRLIDKLQGVDIQVERGFSDDLYPTDDYSGYLRPAPHFTAGWQHMNGSQALIFSRSRHSADPNEGTDFARSHRQSLVMAAALDKIKRLGLLDHLWNLQDYARILEQDAATNIQTTEMVSLAERIKQLDPAKDYLKANWSNRLNFLCDAQAANGAYILLYGSPGSCGTAGGGQQNSPPREQAIHFVQDLLAQANQQAIAANRVLIMGNDPARLLSLQRELKQIGFQDIQWYQPTKKNLANASPSIQPTVSVYIPDHDLRQRFASAAPNFKTSLVIATIAKPPFAFPSALSSAKIIFWLR